MLTVKRYAALGLLAAGLAVAAGCGESTGSVAGVVSYRGQSLTAGTVTFHYPDNEIQSTTIDIDGSYRIPRAPTGEVVVTVSTPREGAAEALDPMKRPQLASPLDPTKGTGLPGMTSGTKGGKAPGAKTAGGKKGRKKAEAEKDPGDPDEVNVKLPQADPLGRGVADGPVKPVVIPERYGIPDQSGLKYRVKAGRQTFDIELD